MGMGGICEVTTKTSAANIEAAIILKTADWLYPRCLVAVLLFSILWLHEPIVSEIPTLKGHIKKSLLNLCTKKIFVGLVCIGMDKAELIINEENRVASMMVYHGFRWSEWEK